MGAKFSSPEESQPNSTNAPISRMPSENSSLEESQPKSTNAPKSRVPSENSDLPRNSQLNRNGEGCSLAAQNNTIDSAAVPTTASGGRDPSSTSSSASQNNTVDSDVVPTIVSGDRGHSSPSSSAAQNNTVESDVVPTIVSGDRGYSSPSSSAAQNNTAESDVVPTIASGDRDPSSPSSSAAQNNTVDSDVVPTIVSCDPGPSSPRSSAAQNNTVDSDVVPTIVSCDPGPSSSSSSAAQNNTVDSDVVPTIVSGDPGPSSPSGNNEMNEDHNSELDDMDNPAAWREEKLFDNKEEENEFRRLAKSNKIDDMLQCLQTQLSKWKAVQMKVAVTGDSGTGKSSFINAIRNLSPEDEGAAEVGVTECIPDQRIEYAHPENPNLKLFDLPGAGTPKFPMATYADDIKLWQYDFCIVNCSDRFRENDMIFAKQLAAKRKRFFFVWNKIDQSISRRSRKMSPDDVLEKVRNDCVSNLKKSGIENPRVYLISNDYPLLYDFPHLADDLLDNFPVFKRDSLTLSLRAFSNELIQEKMKTLKRRIVKVSLLATIDLRRSFQSTPGIHIQTVINEIDFYKKEFGLDETAIAKVMLILKSSEVKNRFIAELEDFKSKSDPEEWIIDMYKEFKGFGIAYQVLAILPLSNIFGTGAISYYLTIRILRKALTQITKEGTAIWKASVKDQLDHASL